MAENIHSSAGYTMAKKHDMDMNDLFQQQQQQQHHARMDGTLERGSTLSLSLKKKMETSHLPKAKTPPVVRFLKENYNVHPGYGMPRSIIYSSFLIYAQKYGIDMVNPASFGKIIRAVFPDLQTRRLGTRGNSKYHYYGIKSKETSEVNQYVLDHLDLEEENSEEMIPEYDMDQETHQDNDKQKGGHDLRWVKDHHEPHDKKDTMGKEHTGTVSKKRKQARSNLEGEPKNLVHPNPLWNKHRSSPQVFKGDDINLFGEDYRHFTNGLLEMICSHNFDPIESYLTHFYQALPKSLWKYLEYDEVIKMVAHTDETMAGMALNTLVPDVLRPIPIATNQIIRQFARQYEVWLLNALHGLPSIFVELKLKIGHGFSQMLRRMTSASHLACAARSIMENEVQVKQMIVDIQRVDFDAMYSQVFWLCPCSPALLDAIGKEFRGYLERHATISEWTQWLSIVLSRCIDMKMDNVHSFLLSAKQFILRWSYVCSLIIRDLTLRSATSFGSFHLLRLFFDEYLLHLVEQRICSSRKNNMSLLNLAELTQAFHFEHHLDGNDSLEHNLSWELDTQTHASTTVDEEHHHQNNGQRQHQPLDSDHHDAHFGGDNHETHIHEDVCQAAFLEDAFDPIHKLPFMKANSKGLRIDSLATILDWKPDK